MEFKLGGIDIGEVIKYMWIRSFSFEYGKLERVKLVLFIF